MNFLSQLNSYFTAENGLIQHPVAFYALLMGIAFVLTFGLTAILVKVAKRFSLFDNTKKKHGTNTRQVPKFGGIAIYIAFLATMAIAALLNPTVAEEITNSKSMAIFAGISIMMLLGLFDDIFDASWIWKFTFQIIAACLVMKYGLVIMKITNPFGNYISFSAPVAFFFTLIWIIGITNAVNLSDGLDGLSIGIIFIVAAVTFTNSIYLANTRPEQSVLFIFATIACICLMGSALGFLRFNFFPAKIFLGDTGSLFLGFLIACIAVRSSQISTTTVAMVVPIIALGLPILDTILVFLRRTAKRRNPFQADMQHIHHKIINSGLSHPSTVLVLYAFCILLGVSAFILAIKKNEYAGVVLFVLTVVILIGFKKYGIMDITRLWGTRNLDDPKDKKKSDK